LPPARSHSISVEAILESYRSGAGYTLSGEVLIATAVKPG
jgi:hypothetical protein